MSETKAMEQRAVSLRGVILVILISICLNDSAYSVDKRAHSSDFTPVVINQSQKRENLRVMESISGHREIDLPIAISVEEVFVIDESSGRNIPTIQLSQRTDTIYDHSYMKLIADITPAPGSLKVCYESIRIPTRNDNGPEPARKNSLLKLENGTYQLLFTLGESTDEYQLVVTDQLLQLIPIRAIITYPVHKKFYRTVPNSFGVYCYTDSVEVHTCDDFLRYLNDNMTVEEIRYPDDGVYMFPKISRGGYYNALPRFFKYDADSDFEQARQILREFNQIHPHSMPGNRVWLLSWRGEFVK